MEDWALIRRLARDGVPKARIARKLGISRTTVINAIASEEPPKYERRPGPTSFTPYEARVRQLLAETPDMPATVLAERVGWTGSIRWFRDNVNRVRVDHRPIDPADRLTWAAGDVAQCDLWFPPRKILLEDGSRTLLPVLVMTCGYSRFTLGRMIPTRKTPDLLLGTWGLLEQLGRVPRRLIWDNEPGIGRGKLSEPVAVFAGTLATKVVLLPPAGPGVQGPGGASQPLLARPPSCPAGTLSPRATSTPSSRTGWPPRTPGWCARSRPGPPSYWRWTRRRCCRYRRRRAHLGWRNHVRLGRDYYVRVDTGDYSVDPRAIGARVDVAADLDTVRVRHGGQLVAEHPRRWARGMTVTDPAHVATAAALRHDYQHPAPPVPEEGEGMVRDLADYDRAFGLEDEDQL